MSKGSYLKVVVSLHRIWRYHVVLEKPTLVHKQDHLSFQEMPHKYEMNAHLRNNSSLYFTNYLNCACYITRNYSSETQLEKQKKGDICSYSAKETQKWHIFFVFILSDILAAALAALL